MAETRRPTEPTRPRVRSARARGPLVLLVVAAALLGPLRSLPAPVRPTGDAHHVARAEASANHHHLAVGHSARGIGESVWRTGTPLGPPPSAALLAGAVVTLLAIARRRAQAWRRPRPAFRRRGPPLRFATG
jgi:hypothetical protein